MAGRARKERARQRRAEALKGCGKFRYRNISGGDLILSKPLNNGRNAIRPGESFVGDDYYQKFVPEHLTLEEVLDTGTPEAPTARDEIDDLPNLGEEVTVQEQLDITIESEEGEDLDPEEEEEEEEEEDSNDERPKVTDELMREMRIYQGMSYSKIAKKLGYSLTYIRKRCKKVEAQESDSQQ